MEGCVAATKMKECEKEEEDRISLLPDCLVVEILLRLQSTKEAITTSTLSRRWKYVWTMIPTLDFKNHNGKDSLSDFFSLVGKTLNQCSSQLKLNKIHLDTSYDVRFESQLNNWIRYAIERDVEHLNLMLGNWLNKAEFVLDKFFFKSSCFTHLKLGHCIFNPIGEISWKNLKSLHIEKGKLNEDLIENILSGSPSLETLILESCIGFRRVNITSKSVKNFVLFGFGSYVDGVTIIEINAPNILSLTIKGAFCLKILFLLYVPSLVKATLDYMCHYEVEGIEEEAEEEDEEMLKRLILNLRHVKELSIGEICSRDFFKLEAKGFISPMKIKVFYCEVTGGVRKLVMYEG